MKLFKKLLIGSTSIALLTPAIAYSFNNTFSSKSKLKDLELSKNYKSTDLKGINTLIAQTDESSDADTLKITVTGTRSPKPVDTFPGSIEVLDQDDLTIKSGSTIKELTDDIPGVTVRTTKRRGVLGPSGTGNVNIRGLDFQRILFLVDGIRLPEPYKFGSYYNLDLGSYVDFNTLSAVEIIKGPASALYGSDALGGLISYRTIKPSDLLDKNENFAGEIPVNYDSSNSGLTESIKIARKLSDKDSIAIVYTKEDSSELNVKADSKFSDDESNSGNNYLINLTRDFDDYTQGSIVYENLSRTAKATVSSANLAAMSSSRTTYTSLVSNDKNNRDRISFEYKYDNPDNDKLFKLFRTKIYSQYARANDNYDRVTSSRGSSTTRNHDYYLKNDSVGGDLEFQSEYNDNKFTYGIDFSEVDTSRLRTTTTVGGSTVEAKDTPDTKITRFGAYIQDEASYGKFDFIVGLRYDTYDLDAKGDSIVSETVAKDLNADEFTPKIAATYNFTDRYTGYAQYSKGFRAPAYYEVNANFSNPRFGYTTISNANLKPETSDSYEVGLRGRYPNLDFNLAGFVNNYDNFINQLTYIGVIDGLATYQTQNVDSAKISGVELAFNLYKNENRKGASFFTSMAYASGDNVTDNEPLDTVNPFEAKYGIKYISDNNKWEAKLTNTFVGKARVAASTTTFVPDAYTVSDLLVIYKPKETFELSAGIYNLFDGAYYNYQDVKGKSKTLSNLTRFTQPERHFKLGATIRF